MGRHLALYVASAAHSANPLGLGSGTRTHSLSNTVLPKVTEDTSLRAVLARSCDHVTFGEGVGECSALNISHETYVLHPKQAARNPSIAVLVNSGPILSPCF